MKLFFTILLCLLLLSTSPVYAEGEKNIDWCKNFNDISKCLSTRNTLEGICDQVVIDGKYAGESALRWRNVCSCIEMYPEGVPPVGGNPCMARIIVSIDDPKGTTVSIRKIYVSPEVNPEIERKLVKDLVQRALNYFESPTGKWPQKITNMVVDNESHRQIILRTLESNYPAQYAPFGRKPQPFGTPGFYGTDYLSGDGIYKPPIEKMSLGTKITGSIIFVALPALELRSGTSGALSSGAWVLNPYYYQYARYGSSAPLNDLYKKPNTGAQRIAFQNPWNIKAWQRAKQVAQGNEVMCDQTPRTLSPCQIQNIIDDQQRFDDYLGGKPSEYVDSKKKIYIPIPNPRLPLVNFR